MEICKAALLDGLAVLHFVWVVTLISQSDFQARSIYCGHLYNKLTSFYHGLHTLDHTNDVMTRCLKFSQIYSL